jgi:glutamate synthase (NADPH) small chain
MVKVDKKGLIITNAKTRKASLKGVAAGVYAGGDIVRGPALVVEAVEDGKQAARAIREALV